MIGHPHEQELLAFQTHQLGESARRRLADHLADCTRCRRVIQLHREVRAAFAAPAPAAPAGLLDRILASRAAGYAVVLPTAEVDARRPGIAIPHRAAVAALALLSVVFASQVVPLTPLKQVWQQWSSAVADWRPFAGQSLHDLPYPTTPVARPAVLHPEQLRPMTLQYESENANWNFTLKLSRVAEGWQIDETQANSTLRTLADSTNFGVIEWTSNWFGTRAYSRVYHHRIDGTTLTRTTGWSGTPPEHTVKRQPPTTEQVDISSFGTGGAFFVGVGQVFFALSVAPLEPGWAGSFRMLPTLNVPRARLAESVSYLVRGEERITTPLGEFDCWLVTRPMASWSSFRIQYWLRKSDGVLVRQRQGTSTEYIDAVLTSITLP